MKQRLPIILFGTLGVILLVYFVYNNSTQQRNKYQWKENYRANSNEPYGTLFIKKLLESYKDEKSFVYNENKPLKEILSNKNNHDTSAYVFIGKSIYLESTDRKELLKFIESGNQAFIASLEVPQDVLNDMGFYGCEDYLYYYSEGSPSVTVNFFHDSLRTAKGFTYTYRQGTKDETYYWGYFGSEFFCVEESGALLYPMGHYADTTINFVKVPYGKGSLFLHSNPILFTNYFMTQEDKLAYASTVFSYIKGKHIIWDEYSKLPFIGDETSQNPLYYILKQPSLKYAWWLLIITSLLYVVFVAKRRQRVIPVLEVKTNTSLEFVKLVADLHYQNRNNLDMARKKMKYFLYFIRSKYGMHAQEFTEKEINLLSEKSGVKEDSIQMIFNMYKGIGHSSAYSLDELILVNFYNAINSFYKHCK